MTRSYCLPLRRAIFGVLLVSCLSLGSQAQPVLTANDYPLTPGEHPYVQYAAENEDGSQTAAINDLINRRGANQVYDFRTLDFDLLFSETAIVSAGAVGPGAEDDLLQQANRTLAVRLSEEYEGELFEVDIYMYALLTTSELRTLGGAFAGSDEEEEFVETIRYEPSGALSAVFPTTHQSTWSSEYTMVMGDDEGTFFQADVHDTHEVDAWGMLIGPGMPEAVPVLRVMVTSRMTLFGMTFETVHYEFLAREGVFATLYPAMENGWRPSRPAARRALTLERPFHAARASDGDVPTADFTLLGAFETSIGEDPQVGDLRVDVPFPHPVSSSATLMLHMAAPATVNATVHDVLGREVQRLVEGQAYPAGAHPLTLDASGLASGVYVIRVQAGGDVFARSVTVVR